MSNQMLPVDELKIIIRELEVIEKKQLNNLSDEVKLLSEEDQKFLDKWILILKKIGGK